jgi:hypothetical protein
LVVIILASDGTHRIPASEPPHVPQAAAEETPSAPPPSEHPAMDGSPLVSRGAKEAPVSDQDRQPAAASPSVAAAPRPEPDVTQDASWRDLHVTAQLRGLGHIGRDLNVGIRAARLEVMRCFRQEPDEARPSSVGADSSRPAVLILHLEGRAGEFEVVGASVAETGATTPAQVECVRWILRGYRIASPGARPGQRIKVRYPVRS